MAVNIHISGETAAEALKDLSQLASGLLSGAAAPTAAPSDASKQEKPARGGRQTKPVDDPKPEPEKPAGEPEAEPIQEDDPAPEESDPDVTDEPIPSVVDLRAKAAEVGADAAKKPKIKALLDEFQVPNITAVPENRRAEFLRRLSAL